jgi:hypothetical protein
MPKQRSAIYSRSGLLASLVLVVAALQLAGCKRGADRASVEGIVRIDGRPLEAGALNLVPVDKATGYSAGARIVAGLYAIAGPKAPVPGKYRVQIVGTRKSGRQVPDMFRSGKMVDAIEQFIPDSYNTRSRLEVSLHAGENKGVDFDLKSKP